jgi:hypothetical protein
LKESIGAYGDADSDKTGKNTAMSDTNTIPWKQEDALEW